MLNMSKMFVLFVESFLFIYRKFLYMTMDIYSIYMRNDDPWKSFIYAKVTILEKEG